MEYMRTHSYKLADQVNKLQHAVWCLQILSLTVFANILFTFDLYFWSSFSCKQRQYALQIHLFIMNSELLRIIWKSSFLFSLQCAYPQIFKCYQWQKLSRQHSINFRYGKAVRWFEKTLAHIPSVLTEIWEATVVNLAHAYRKLRYSCANTTTMIFFLCWQSCVWM